jgi:predicted DNA-binding WGR domain protein
MANIIESKKFIWAEAQANHNKWWEVILYDNDDVVTKWARVGNDPQSKTFSGVGKSFMEKKIGEKLAKGYTEAKVIDASTPVASARPPTVAVSNLHEIAKSQIIRSSGSPILDKLIERLVKSNVHKITSTTNITLNDTTGLFQTPLGIVTPDAIIEARSLLADTVPFVKNSRYNDQLDKLVSDYLRLVPQSIGMKFDVRRILPDVTAIQKQNDILDALEASYAAITKPKADTSKKTDNKTTIEQVFKVDLDVENGPDANRLERWFETSKNRMHGYDRIKVRNIFKIKVHEMDNAFISDNPKEVFHGTSEANCLSILKSGLRTSPPSTAAIAGKMWGNGVYGAINSSKSLGYTYGRWGQSTGEAGWLFICKFAMGKIHYPRGYGNCSRPPLGYDSIWATVANTGLNHDELIVYANNRVNITHLLECK